MVRGEEVIGRYRRAAAGVMGFLLLGGALGTTVYRRHLASPLSSKGSSIPQQTPDVLEPAEAGNSGALDAVAPMNRLLWSRAQPYSTAQLAPLTYSIQPGDSLWYIAKMLDTEVKVLMDLNPGVEPTRLQPGQLVNVVGATYFVQPGDNLDSISAMYGITPLEIRKLNNLSAEASVKPNDRLLLPNTRSRTALASRDGPRPKTVAASVTATAATVPEQKAPQQKTPPQKAPEATAKKAEPEQKNQAGQGEWAWPVKGGSPSSEYGYRSNGFHTGLDLAVPTGTPITASKAGKVIFAGVDGGYGLCVLIDHGDGYKTRYAHGSKTKVEVGQTVEQGAIVMLSGSTGNSTGPHLHFEVIANGKAQNPRNYLS